jgi:hypothetical protein
MLSPIFPLKFPRNYLANPASLKLPRESIKFNAIFPGSNELSLL